MPEWPPANGEYSCIFNPGASLALNIASPGYISAGKIHSSRIVPLKHWLDVVWLRWLQYYDNGQRYRLESIRSIVECDINDEQTRAVVDKVKRRSQYLLKPFSEFP